MVYCKPEGAVARLQDAMGRVGREKEGIPPHERHWVALYLENRAPFQEHHPFVLFLIVECRIGSAATHNAFYPKRARLQKGLETFTGGGRSGVRI